VVFFKCVITYNHPVAPPLRAPVPSLQRKRRSTPRPFAKKTQAKIAFVSERAAAYFAQADRDFSWFGDAVGLLNANVTRVLRRVFGIRTADIPVADLHAEVFRRYANAVSTASPNARATNLGLLDLGATVCTPRPKCDGCPLAAECHYATVATF
jgi:adenine-specific DNA glycosylase